MSLGGLRCGRLGHKFPRSYKRIRLSRNYASGAKSEAREQQYAEESHCIHYSLPLL
jgi:hypothetical protein